MRHIDPLIQSWLLVAEDGSKLDELLAQYHPEVHFRDPMQEVRGLAAFRETMDSFRDGAKALEIDFEDVVAVGSSAVLVWRMDLTPKVGPALQIDGTSHLRFEDGLVVYQRDYWDLADSLVSIFPGLRRAWRALMKPFT